MLFWVFFIVKYPYKSFLVAGTDLVMVGIRSELVGIIVTLRRNWSESVSGLVGNGRKRSEFGGIHLRGGP